MQIEDRLAVQDVVILYAHLLDSGQSHRIAAEIFTEDAAIEYGGALVSGRPAITAFLTDFSGLLGTSHNVSNFIVEGEGNTARCQSHCMAWHWMKHPEIDGRTPIRPTDILAVGGYQDVLRREPVGWRISQRRMLSFGTGIGVGTLPDQLRPLFDGMLGRLPEWP